MAKVWADFYDWVKPEVPGAPNAEVDHVLRESAIDFYDRSGVLVVAQSPITVVSGQSTYSFAAVSGYDLNRIEEMMMGSLRLLPVSNSQLAQIYINWQTISGPPQFYFRETTDTFRLVPSPDQNYTDTIVPRVVLAPSRSSTGIAEDWIFENWVDAIAAGALAELLRMPAKPWTDLQRAVIYEDIFHRGWGAVRNQKDRGMAGAVLQVRLKRFF